MTKTLPKFTMYNSASYNRTVALWRYCPGGIIETDYYDYTTCKLGPYTFADNYGYVKEFYVDKATPPVHLLYEALINSREAVAAFFANNTYVCLVYPDSLYYRDIESGETFNYHKGSNFIKTKDMVNIGWVKTYVLCQEAAHVPYYLQVEISSLKAYLGNGRWSSEPIFDMSVANPDFSLYKKLLTNSDAVAVYTEMSGKEIYLK